ncbi:peptide deformylase [Burkholderia contaminans]|nr:peptide deformylase [Burkholderia contaminans]
MIYLDGGGVGCNWWNKRDNIAAAAVSGGTQEAYDLEAIMYNPKIVSHSVQDAALGEGEGCLSVDRNVPGYVVRHARVTIDYFDKDGEKHRIKLKGYNSIGVQHEIDHINGIMFYDRINEKDPFAVKDGLLILE